MKLMRLIRNENLQLGVRYNEVSYGVEHSYI